MRERKREFVGRVVSDKMDKTVVVTVQTLRRHRLYQRMMRRSKKYMAHDEQNGCKIGDLVRIRESRPISRHKSWIVINVLERAAERGKAVDLPAGIVAAAPVEAEVAAAAGIATEEESA
jgi:small subunit ribosomal protein S17